MPDYGLSEYKRIMTEILRLMKEHLTTIETITDCQDPRWVKICMDFDRIYDNAPADMKDYADSMVKMHIYELERRWRH